MSERATQPPRVQERLDFDDPPLRPRGGADAAAAAAALRARLTMQRPVAAIDLETTGLDPQQDRIVEVAIVRVEPREGHELLHSLVDPGCPIPAAATRVHGIRDADVRGAPTLAELAPRIERLLAGCTLVGYNLERFDLPLLAAELARAGHRLEWRSRCVLDACTIFKRKERRDLSAAYRFYCGAELRSGHRAADDAVATIEVLAGQLARYRDLPRDPELLCRWLAPRPAAPPEE